MRGVWLGGLLSEGVRDEEKDDVPGSGLGWVLQSSSNSLSDTVGIPQHLG